MRKVLAAGCLSLSFAVPLGGVALAWFSACSSSSDDNALAPGGGASSDALALFRALEPDLVTTCGGDKGQCHVLGTVDSAPKWLSDGDHYAAIKAYRGVLPLSGNIDESILLTQVVHAGPALSSAPSLRARVKDWTAAELTARGTHIIGPDAILALSGPQSFDLSALGSALAGTRIAFQSSSDGTRFTLQSVTLTAPAAHAVIIDSPYFVLVPADGAGKVVEDPAVNGFAGKQTVPAGTSAQLFTGSVTLSGPTRGAKLRVYMSSLTIGDAGSGVAFSCNAVSTFESRAIPAFNTAVPVADGGTGTCYQCHSGGDATARAAFDLSKMGTDNAAACAEARRQINFTDKTMSRILQNPEGTSPAHPVGGLAPTSAVVTGIKAWVDAEMP